MSDDLVERIARAICKSRTCEGVNCCQWPAQGGRTTCPVRNGGYNSAACAALKAIEAAGYVIVPTVKVLRDGLKS